jgi:hypothetical protein
MKKIKLSFLSILVLGTTVLSCSKDDAVINNSSLMAGSGNPLYHFSVRAAYNVGLAGIDPSENLKLPIDSVAPPEEPKYPFEVIEVPTPTYKKETCLLDISKLECHKTYHAIKNGKLILGFFNENGSKARALKLNSSPEGWDAIWGCDGVVELKSPDVLYFSITSLNVTVIYLSKPCTEFGFELAPDLQDYDHKIAVAFGTSSKDSSEGCVTSTVRSPAGARLFALKATKPFTTITIRLKDTPTDIAVNGIGMANIRYKLAE